MKKNKTDNFIGFKDAIIKIEQQNQYTLKSINNELKPGSILGLLGLNSSGKTSLFKKIAGIENHFLKEGFKYYLDIIEKNKNSDISYLADIELLPSEIKVYETVNYFFDIMNSFNKNRALEDLKKLNFNLNLPIQSLSQGQKKALLFILTIYCKAAVYLFDEPFANLDIIMRNYVLEMLIGEISDKKIFIITTHELFELENIFSHIMILNDNTSSNIYEVEKIRENKSLNDFYMEAINVKNY